MRRSLDLRKETLAELTRTDLADVVGRGLTLLGCSYDVLACDFTGDRCVALSLPCYSWHTEESACG